ncbi:MAG: hypothetical protein NC115_10250, partial [Bacteroidales bacterium]|nr:hypothetical protein [Bacteroidales bacterium]
KPNKRNQTKETKQKKPNKRNQTKYAAKRNKPNATSQWIADDDGRLSMCHPFQDDRKLQNIKHQASLQITFLKWRSLD